MAYARIGIGILALLKNGTGVFAYDGGRLEISAQKRVSTFMLSTALVAIKEGKLEAWVC